MRLEFKRFQLNNTQRKITGISQVLGGISLLIGLGIPIIGLIAAASLGLLMLLGFIVRLKIKDSIILSLPSFTFMLINGYLFLNFLKIYT